jgi:GTPase involved in cell partitioning and DNA repair
MGSLSSISSTVIMGQAGKNGSGKNRSGRKGQDQIVYVPVGTIVKEKNKTVADLSSTDSKYIIATGGEGGKGNQHFATGINRAPRLRTFGKLGQTRKVELELKSIADIGLVGYPNAGKSTFLGSISSTKPTVAAYPFTTLHPTVGKVIIDTQSEISIADMPGLIEGAHANVGLGHAFLRHIERTKFLAMVLDISGLEGIGIQKDAKGNLTYEFPDPKLNPPPNLSQNTPFVEDVVQKVVASKPVRFNVTNLMSDYGIEVPENEIPDEDPVIMQNLSYPKTKRMENKILPPEPEVLEREVALQKAEVVPKDINEHDEFDEEEQENDPLEDEIAKMNEYEQVARDVRSRKPSMYHVQPWEVMEKLNSELDNYIPGLSGRVKLIIANKVDVPGAAKNLAILKTKTDLPIFPISALNRQNLKPVLLYMRNILLQQREKEKDIL